MAQSRSSNRSCPALDAQISPLRLPPALTTLPGEWRHPPWAISRIFLIPGVPRCALMSSVGKLSSSARKSTAHAVQLLRLMPPGNLRCRRREIQSKSAKTTAAMTSLMVLIFCYQSRIIHATDVENSLSICSLAISTIMLEDWETAADLPLPDIVGISRSQEPENEKPESPTRRRGRGHFQYKKDGLYSDQINESEFAGRSNSEEDLDRRETSDLSSSRSASLKHVLVLQDFPQSVRTTDLEKIFQAFSEDGVAIRWVHDTCALAVFRTPSAASRALSSTSCQFKVRMIDDTSDAILSQISSKDLEPPILRPKTSARTAQRMIVQSMGIKVNSSFGSKELRIQERERRSRIQARQGLRDDAWGSDDP